EIRSWSHSEKRWRLRFSFPGRAKLRYDLSLLNTTERVDIRPVINRSLPMKIFRLKTLAAAALIGIALPASSFAQELVNVSYDPTRELCREYGDHFSRLWKDKTG